MKDVCSVCLKYDMKIKQKITSSILIMATFFSVMFAAMPVSVGAEDCKDPAKCCAGVDTSIITCTQTGNGKSARDSGVWGILLIALNIMTAGVGILAVGGIVYGAILYASSEENASQVQKAKDIIKNVVIGLIAYGAMYLLLNYLIPGGIFS